MSVEPTLEPTVSADDIDEGEESDEYEVEVRKPLPNVLATHAYFFIRTCSNSFRIKFLH
jgi:hypothetical protein